MSRPKEARNRQLRRRRTNGVSMSRLAREFRITRTTVKRVLDATGGDPLATELADLARAGVIDLERERDRLQDRIRSDRRRLRIVQDELETRRTNRILGLTG